MTHIYDEELATPEVLQTMRNDVALLSQITGLAPLKVARLIGAHPCTCENCISNMHTMLTESSIVSVLSKSTIHALVQNMQAGVASPAADTGSAYDLKSNESVAVGYIITEDKNTEGKNWAHVGIGIRTSPNNWHFRKFDDLRNVQQEVEVVPDTEFFPVLAIANGPAILLGNALLLNEALRKHCTAAETSAGHTVN